MGLKSVSLQKSYQSSGRDILEQFYIPCLKETTKYKRAVGYFTSESLAVAAKGLASFLSKEDAEMKLIASPTLKKDDINAIRKGYDVRGEKLERNMLEELQDVENAIVQARLGFVAWMVADGTLDVKIAHVSDPGSMGIYHQKMGIFIDEAGDSVAFSGSPNETRGGLYRNFEAIDVFTSWESDERVRHKDNQFDRLWNNNCGGVEILEFPEAVREELLKYQPSSMPDSDPVFSNNSAKETPKPNQSSQSAENQDVKIPEPIELRNYQKEAVAAWFENDAKGVFKMATGTGKTITALSASVKLLEYYRSRDIPLVIIVVCPYQHLVTQWADEARNFGFEPVKCFGSRKSWMKEANSLVNATNSAIRSETVFITTATSFAMEPFQALMNNIEVPMLFISDEMHNLGSEKAQRALPKNVENRLGLSATPERWFDDEGTEKLFDYFGNPVIEFGLEEAIDQGYLTPYDYHPIVVPLTETEMEEYLHLSKKIAVRMSAESDLEENTAVKRLLIQRSRLTATAENKLSILKQTLKSEGIAETQHNLIYCGTGEVNSRTGESTSKQIDAVTKMLGEDLEMHVAKYVAETNTQERKEILKDFESGDLQALVAIQCLDEGVDVPATRRAFILASTSNPRQFIQRRGRVLRTSPGKKKAEIWDFLVIPPSDRIGTSHFNTQRNLIRKELKRSLRFCRLARNGAQASNELLELKKDYNLLHL